MSPVDKTIAVLDMDGLGRYRVSNFQKSEKCVKFIDGAGEPVNFCGSFDLTEQKDFYKLKSQPW